MKVGARQLPLEFGGSGGSGADGARVRREARQSIVRIVEHHRFPRACEGSRKGIGYTRDVSPSGMCLSTEHPEPVGALLHVIVRGVDGRPTLDSLARVLRCEDAPGGRRWLGLELLDLRRPGPVSVRTRRSALALA